MILIRTVVRLKGVEALLEQGQEEKILAAAYTILAREGYSQTSLRQIAKEADVAVSQISYHFNNKEGLLLSVATKVADHYLDYMQAYLEPQMTPKEKAEGFIHVYQQVLLERPDLFRVLYDLVGLALWSEPFRIKVRQIFQGIMDKISTEVFTTEIMGELGHGHAPSALASVFFGGIFGVGVQILLEPENKEIPRSLGALHALFRPREVR